MTPSALSTLETLNGQAVSGLGSMQGTGTGVPGQQSSVGGGPLLVLWEHLPVQGWPIHPQSRLTTCLASTFLPMVPALQPQRRPLHPDCLFSTLHPRQPIRPSWPAQISTIPGFPGALPSSLSRVAPRPQHRVCLVLWSQTQGCCVCFLYSHQHGT